MDSQQFLSALQSDFDEKEFVSKVLESKNLSEPLTLVSNRLSELDASIYQHVSQHNTELLSQTVELENFSNIVESVDSRIRNLSVDVNRINLRLSRPYELISSQVSRIQRLSLLCETLRHILRISTTVKRLLGSTEDLVLASECINELEYAFASMDWEGIVALEEHHATLISEKDKLTKKAWALVGSSLDSGDQARLGLGLQAFDNLGILPKIIQSLISDWQEQIEGAIKVAVDVDAIAKKAKSKVILSLTSSTGPGRASIPSSGGQAAAFRSLLWTGLDQMVTSLDRCLHQTRLLSETLRKKRPSLGGLLAANTTLAGRLCAHVIDNWNQAEEADCCAAIFMVLAHEKGGHTLDSVVAGLAGAESYREGLLGWTATCLGALIEPALRRRSGQLRDALEGEYPRLLKLFLNLGRQQHSPVLASPLQRLLGPFETAYLTRSLTRLFDRVNAAFAGVTNGVAGNGEVPNIAVAERIVQAVATELAHAAAVHEDLFCKVAKNTIKVIALFATKVEGLIAISPDASRVSTEGTPTAAQLSNIHLVNFTCAFADRLRLAVARHTASNQQSRIGGRFQECVGGGMTRAQARVDAALATHLSTVCLSALDLLLGAVTDHITLSLFPRMHTSEGASSPSYVEDLQKFVAHVRTVYLVEFSTPTSLAVRPAVNERLFTSGAMALRSALQSQVLPRCLDALAVNTSLVRPCATEAERCRLVTDSAEVEMSLLTFVSPTATHLPDTDAQRRLKALRRIISIPTGELLSTCASIDGPRPPPENRGTVGFVGPQLPGSLVLHHAIARAPEEIPLPYQSASGWSLERYTQWCLSTADESSRLDFVAKALDIYVAQVGSRQQRQYPQIYPIIRDLLAHYAKE